MKRATPRTDKPTELCHFHSSSVPPQKPLLGNIVSIKYERQIIKFPKANQFLDYLHKQLFCSIECKFKLLSATINVLTISYVEITSVDD